MIGMWPLYVKPFHNIYVTVVMVTIRRGAKMLRLIHIYVMILRFSIQYANLDNIPVFPPKMPNVSVEFLSPCPYHCNG